MQTSESAQPKIPVGKTRNAALLSTATLRQRCLAAGADDVGFVSIDRPELDDQRADILSVFPKAKILISIVCRMNRAPIQSTARSIANLEMHHIGDEVNEVAHRIVASFEQEGVEAINPAMGFPMEMSRWPGKLWVVSHKPVAVAAGLGQMGIHRNIIHPRFGNFILLGTIVIGAHVDVESRPIDYNPCLECKLCVAACPVGAIGSDGYFDFSACYTHNYREFMGGFTDWVGTVTNSKNRSAYRKQVSDPETVSMWQSLAFGPNYKAAYCMAVCPAGEEVIRDYREDKALYLSEIVKPLQQKKETLYVVKGSDGEAQAARRFPHKKRKAVGGSLFPQDIAGFLSGMPMVFQRHQSEGLNACYHFTFTGEEQVKTTIEIRDKQLRIQEGHVGKADLRVWADSKTWLKFLAQEVSIASALLRFKVRLVGSPKLLLAFGRCFPA